MAYSCIRSRGASRSKPWATTTDAPPESSRATRERRAERAGALQARGARLGRIPLRLNLYMYKSYWRVVAIVQLDVCTREGRGCRERILFGGGVRLALLVRWEHLGVSWVAPHQQVASLGRGDALTVGGCVGVDPREAHGEAGGSSCLNAASLPARAAPPPFVRHECQRNKVENKRWPPKQETSASVLRSHDGHSALDTEDVSSPSGMDSD